MNNLFIYFARKNLTDKIIVNYKLRASLWARGLNLSFNI